MNLDDDGVAQLVELLAPGQLVELELSHNTRISAAGLRVLGASAALTGLKQLNFVAALHERESGEVFDALSAIANATRASELSALDLSRNGIGSDAIEALCSDRLRSLRTLRLGDNPIGDEGLTKLSRSPLKLHRLSVRDAGIGDAGVVALAGSALLGHLQHLDLENNHIGEQGTVALGKSPRVASLESLRLTDCHGRPPSSLAGIEALGHSIHLTPSARCAWHAKAMASQMWFKGKQLPDHAEAPNHGLPRLSEIIVFDADMQKQITERTPRSIGDAWQLLTEISEQAERRSLSLVGEWQPFTAHEPDGFFDSHYEPANVVRDAALASFVKTHAGQLEAQLLASFDELMRPRAWSDPSPRVDVLFGDPPDSSEALATHGDPGSLMLTIAAMHPAAGLALCDRLFGAIDSRDGAQRNWHEQEHEEEIRRRRRRTDAHPDGEVGDENQSNLWSRLCSLAGFFVRQSSTKALSDLRLMAPEFRDTVRYLAHGDWEALPVLFEGPNAHTLSAEDIEDQIVDYTRLPLARIELALQPRRLSHPGFLQPNQTLGTVVRADLRALHSAGVSRAALAKRLEAVVVEARNQDPIGYSRSRGHQQHPFHRVDTYAFTQRGSTSARLSLEPHSAKPDAPFLWFGDLLPDLIRRFAFFEGPGGLYRLNPLKAARLIGLG